MRFWPALLVVFISVSLTLEAALKNGYITENIETSKTLYNCVYSGLWCSCYSNNRGGCSIGCSPSPYITLYNQTSCPQKENFLLSGFTVLSF